MPDIIQLGDLAVQVFRKDIRNIHLSVYPPEGRVVISCPSRHSLEKIRAYALAKPSKPAAHCPGHRVFYVEPQSVLAALSPRLARYPLRVHSINGTASTSFGGTCLPRLANLAAQRQVAPTRALPPPLRRLPTR